MAQGAQRREGASDSLVGASEVTPTIQQAPQLQIPNASVPDVVNTMQGRIASSLQGWVSGQLQETANKQNEAAILDGQMAYQQGVAMDSVDMPGDKFAMQGYRVMQAQTLSSTMLASQQEMIRQSQYEQDPDTFRRTYVNRMEQQLDGLDPQTARLVREQMSTHMPQLVTQQTVAYMQNEEQNAFDTLVASIDPMSQDSTAFDALLANAVGGEGSASAGLSPDRTRTAVAAGVVAAFNNGNPEAFQKLEESGVLADLPDSERQAVLAAQQQYEQKLRTTYNQEYTVAMAEHERKVAAGGYASEQASVDAVIAINAQLGVSTTAAEAGSTYRGQSAARDQNERAAVNNIAAAQARGDYRSVAAQTVGFVLHRESGGNLDAVGPLIEGGANRGDRAQTGMQVMPKTMADPGFGIRPSDGTQADTLRVGREYWAMNVARYAGDLEAAAIGYNAGPGNADKWIEAGGGEAGWAALEAAGVRVSETRPYAEGIAADATGDGLYFTAAENNAMSGTALTAATNIRNGIIEAEGAQATIEREHAYELAMVQPTLDLQNGTISPAAYQQQAQAAMQTHQVDLTRSIGGAQVSAVRNGITQAQIRAEERGDDDMKQNLSAFDSSVANATNVYLAAIGQDGVTPERADALNSAYLGTVRRFAEDAGITLEQSDFDQAIARTGTQTRAAAARHKDYAVNQTIAQNAIATGSVGELSPTLRTVAEGIQNSETDTTVANAVASGALSQDDSVVATSQANMAQAIQAGTVSQETARVSTAMMRQKLTTADGDPNPQVMQTLAEWDTLRQENPDVAATMFDEKGNMLAEAVLNAAGGTLSGEGHIGAAMMQIEREKSDNANLLTGNIVTDSTVLNQMAINSVEDFIKGEVALDSLAPGLFRTNGRLQSEMDAIGGEALSADFQAKLMQEVIRMQSVHPGLSGDEYVRQAASSIFGRTAFIGGSALMMDKGHGVAEQMFGDETTRFNAEGVEQKAYLNAMRNLAESDPEQWGWITDTTFAENSGFMVRGGLAALEGLGFDVNRPVIAGDDTSSVIARQMRPFSAFSPDGKVVGIRVLMPNGSMSDPLPLTVQDVGQQWKERIREDVTGRYNPQGPQFPGDIPN